MTNAHSPIAQALGRVPSGLFLVSTERGAEPLGFVGSLVQQVAFRPPTLMVAIAKGREHLSAVRASGRFAVSVFGAGDRPLLKPFFRPPASGSPFDLVSTKRTTRGSTVLGDALAWLDCRLVGEHDAGDHVAVFGVVEEGERQRDAEPLVHVRRNGLDY